MWDESERGARVAGMLVGILFLAIIVLAGATGGWQAAALATGALLASSAILTALGLLGNLIVLGCLFSTIYLSRKACGLLKALLPNGGGAR